MRLTTSSAWMPPSLRRIGQGPREQRAWGASWEANQLQEPFLLAWTLLGLAEAWEEDVILGLWMDGRKGGG